MKGAFAKDIARSIRHSLGRFFAILIIVALGSGFYAGLRMTAPDMRLSADRYYDGTSLYDIRVLSTLGFSDDLIAELAGTEGVAEVMPAHETDVMAVIEGNQYTIRVHSLDTESARNSDTSDGVTSLSDNEGYLNRPILISGDWPTEPGQCVLSAETITASPLSIGDTVQVSEGIGDLDEILNTKEFTITGFVRSSYYSSCESLGVTSLGSGVIQQYMYISDDDFKDEYPPTNVFLTVAGASAQPNSSERYDEVVSPVMDRLNENESAIAQKRLAEIKGEAQGKIDESRADYEAERADVEAQLAKAASSLDDARQTLDESKVVLNNSASTIAASESKLVAGESDLAAGKKTLESQRHEGEAALAVAQAAIEEKQTEVDALAAQIDSVNASREEIKHILSTMDPADPRYAELVAQDAALAQAIADMQTAYESASTLIVQSQEALAAEKAQAYAMLSQAQATLDASAQELTQGWADLAQGKADYAAGEATLAQGEAEYEAKLREYEDSVAEAHDGFAEAEAGIADAQAEVDALEEPSIYIMDRSKNYGAKSFDSDAGRIDQIAQVFPLLFFLVAALVALTTMTRMVEEERALIGTYKALGYSRQRIASKYLIYAFAASAIGSIIGICTLTQILPNVITGAYSIMYDIPTGVTPIDVPIAVMSAVLGIGVTCFAAWAAAISTLRERPASLMLPRVPKPGKRIVLERIGFIWKRFTFSWKVTSRNLFRYKKRLAMTLIGIAGCTSLLLTGLGLSDAIGDIIPKQFGQIYRYNLTITLADDIDDDDVSAVENTIDNTDYVESSARAYTENITVLKDGVTQAVNLTVPQDPDEFSHFHVMRNRISQESLALDDDTVIISEKLATELQVGVGDTITFARQDAAGYTTDEHYDVLVGGVMENYVSHFVMMSPALYTETTGDMPSFSTIFAQATSDSGKRADITDSLLPLDGVKTVAFNDEVIESYEKGLASVDSVVVVLIIAAAALAFVVLYNLTNINITERTREIATLKVLGFTKREVIGYVFREMIILTIIGALLGLVLGVFMEWFVVSTAEVDAVMFGRDIHAASFLLAFVFTIAFSFIVAFFMRGKLARIDMVESLKSVE